MLVKQNHQSKKKKKKIENYPLGMAMETIGSEADSLGYSQWRKDAISWSSKEIPTFKESIVSEVLADFLNERAYCHS